MIKSNLIVMNKPRDKSNPVDAWNKDHLFRKVQRGNARRMMGMKFLSLESTDAREPVSARMIIDETSNEIRE
jgi:hypothetical protein